MRYLIIACLILLSGCSVGRHQGMIETFNAAGESTGSYIVTLDRPMLMKAGCVEADSRGDSSWGKFLQGMVNGAVNIATLGILAD